MDERVDGAMEALFIRSRLWFWKYLKGQREILILNILKCLTRKTSF